MSHILVRFLPPTNFLGARVKAISMGGTTIIRPFQYELSSNELRAIDVAQELISLLKYDNVKATKAYWMNDQDYYVDYN